MNKVKVVSGVVGGLILIAGLASVAMLRDLDQPVSFDAQGKMHGTGDLVYEYKTKAPKLVDHVVRGKLVRSEWFRPDRTSIMVTEWKDGSGVGLYLREDGSIRSRMTYVHEIAEGPATYYAPDGSVQGEAIFKDGQRVSGYEPPKSTEKDK